MRFFKTFVSYLLSVFIIIIGLGGLDALKSFFDLTSILVIIVSIILAMSNFSLSEVYNAMADSLSSKARDGFLKRYKTDKLILESLGKYSILVSSLFFTVLLLITLANLEDLKAFSISLVSIFLVILYSFLFKLFILSPLITSLDKKYIDINN